MTVMVYDIETVPDIENCRRLYNLEGCTDDMVYDAVISTRLQTHNNEFLPLHLHKIVAISVVVANKDFVKVWSLGTENAAEVQLIERFYSGLEQYIPTLVSWNGKGFDMPVLHYRSMLHKVQASLYWDMGEQDSTFKWNNYVNRYHTRHLDIMDVLSSYQKNACIGLDALSELLHFPGKMGMKGNKVWACYQAGEIKAIRHYCETDVLNTYLLYLRFQWMRGQLTPETYQFEQIRLKEYLANSPKTHLQEFLKLWN